MSSIKPTMPPIGGRSTGGLLKIIARIVKGIWNFISGSAKTGGNRNSINEDSSLENIDKIMDIFSDFKEQVHSRSVEIEKSLTDEVGFYLDEVKQLLIDHQSASGKYGIKIERIEQKIDRILPRMSGVIDHELSKRVSLDNTECRNIMKMIPGENKEIALNSFLNESVSQALYACCKNLRENLDEIIEEVEDEIIGAVESIQKNSEATLKKLEEVDAGHCAEQASKLMSDACYLIDACSLVDEIMMEV